MRNKMTALLGAVGALVATAPLYAHHSFTAEFDEKKPITIEGKVIKVEITSPHGYVHLAVKGTDGKTKIYSVQTGAPSRLTPGDRQAFAIGNTIIASGWLARDGTDHVIGFTVKTADGKILQSINPRGPAEP